MMEDANRLFILVLHGIKDCFCGITASRHFLSSSKEDSTLVNTAVSPKSQSTSVTTLVLQCFLYCIIFWICNLIFDIILMDIVLSWILMFFMIEISSVQLLIKFLNFLFLTMWIIPQLFIHRILHCIWYEDIAAFSLKKSGVKRSVIPRLSVSLADQIQSFILEALFLAQANVLYFIPLPVIVQHLWYIVHVSLLSSLYAFDYKWVRIGWPLHKRLSNFAAKWPYFLGFGLPLAAATSFISLINSMTLFAVLFPFYLIGSSVAPDSQIEPFHYPFNLFKFVDMITDVVVTFVLNNLQNFFKMFSAIKLLIFR